VNIVRAAIAAAVLWPACASAQQQNDLREFRVDMPVSALPDSGYRGFACAADPSRKLSGWDDYKTCSPAADGTRAVSFRYAAAAPSQDDNSTKTEVSGQPVTLALLIGSDEHVAGIMIATDPHARFYLHKKAFLFGLQVRARFGEDGWTCRQSQPTPTRQPVGGVFIDEHCEKATASRHFIVDRQLFRDPAKPLGDFTDATQLVILRAG
jgi:hypothetical protein